MKRRRSHAAPGFHVCMSGGAAGARWHLQPARRDLAKQQTKASPQAMTFAVSCPQSQRSTLTVLTVRYGTGHAEGTSFRDASLMQSLGQSQVS